MIVDAQKPNGEFVNRLALLSLLYLSNLRARFHSRMHCRCPLICVRKVNSYVSLSGMHYGLNGATINRACLSDDRLLHARVYLSLNWYIFFYYRLCNFLDVFTQPWLSVVEDFCNYYANWKKRRTFLFADKTDLKSIKKNLQREWF